MDDQTNQLIAKLVTLNDSLDDLEDILEPLFVQSLPETTVGLEPIQQAKLQTVIPYLVYDLIFIYLKSRGIDPRTHAVFSELDRVRQYFGKITNAEADPKKRTATVDRAAAGRFIKHAIAQAQWKPTAAEQEENSEKDTPEPQKSRVPVVVTSKMAERAQYERNLRKEDAEESDGELEVFGEQEVQHSEKQKVSEMPKPSTNLKRRPMDPFAGYEDEPSPMNAQTASKRPKSTNLSATLLPNTSPRTPEPPNPSAANSTYANPRTPQADNLGADTKQSTASSNIGKAKKKAKKSEKERNKI